MKPATLNMTSIEKYGITFAKIARFNGRFKVNSVNDCLSSFLGEHNSLIEASRLLNGINAAINQTMQDLERGFPTQGMIIAIIDVNKTRIYGDLEEYTNDRTITPSFILPTLDLKEIVEAWIKFLNEMG